MSSPSADRIVPEETHYQERPAPTRPAPPSRPSSATLFYRPLSDGEKRIQGLSDADATEELSTNKSNLTGFLVPGRRKLPPIPTITPSALVDVGSLPISDKRSSRSSVRPTYSSSNSTLVLGLVADVCEAFSGVPYVKIVAGLVQKIIEIADKVQAYKDKCQALIDEVTLFSRAVFEGLLKLSKIASPAEQLQDLEKDLLEFNRVLKDIYALLNDATARRDSSRFLRYFAPDEFLQVLVEQDEHLKKYIRYFNTKSNIATRLGLGTVLNQSLLNALSQPSYTIKRPIPVSQTLYGRDSEVATIVDLMLSNQQVHLAILGAGGMGKTSLALSILANERVKSKFEKRFFLSCESTPSPDLFLHELASTLDITTDRHSPQLLRMITQQLQQQSCLLVFDNLETLWAPSGIQTDVESLLSQISSISTVSLLVTLRGSQHPAGVDWTELLPPLEPLDLSSSRALFSKISHKSDDIHAVKLIEAVGCIPLAVTLLAHLAAVQNVTTESLWERWIEEKTTMIERGDDRLTSLDTSIRFSLHSPRMNRDPNALSFLSLIALLPNGMSYDMFRACDVHLPKIIDINVKRAVDTLRQNTLIYEDADKTLRILSPIRHYVLSHHPPSGTSSEFIEEYFLQLALLGGERDISVRDRLRYEIGNLDEVLVRALGSSLRPIRDTIVAILSLAEYTFVTGVGSCVPLERATERLEQIAPSKSKSRPSTKTTLRRLFLGRSNEDTTGKGDGAKDDPVTLQADCLGCWGQLLSRQGHYVEAKEKFELALQLHLRRGDIAGQAADLHNLGCLLTLDEAMDKFTTASRLHKKIGDRAGVAYDMMGLGQVYVQRFQLSKAREIFVSALLIFIGLEGEGKDTIGRATAINNIGYTLMAWNKFAEAEEYFNRAIQANKDIDDIICKADSLRGLASTFLPRSRWTEAEEKIKEAMTVRKPFEDPNHYCVLGRIKCAQWKLSEAITTLEYARTLPRDLKDDFGRGGDLRSLAHTLTRIGRLDESSTMLEEAKAMYKSSENPACLAGVGVDQAEIWIIQGKLNQAETTLNEVMKDLDCRFEKAHALYVFGGLELKKGAYRNAKKYVQLAFGLHGEIGTVQEQADDLVRLAEILVMERKQEEVGGSWLEEAIWKVNKAMALHERIGDIGGMGDGWYTRAIIGLKRRNLVEAEEAVNKALEMHCAAEAVPKQGRDHLLSGYVLKAQGRREEAVQALDLATSIFEQIGATIQRMLCRAVMEAM